MDQLAKEFVTRTRRHIELVNKYAGKIGAKFIEHDNSKLHLLRDAYKFFMKEDRTPEEENILDQATLLHIKNASHHPEYWTRTSLKGFTRKNPTPNGPIDAREMPQEALVEMVADWCAVSEEKGTNTPFEWFESVRNTRWIFNEEQEQFILQVMDKMWNE